MSEANGDHSFATNRLTKANGYAAFAEGYMTNANGTQSHAEGGETVANGRSSHAEGSWTQTNNLGEHAEGVWNKSNSNTISSIGIGNKDERKNALEVSQSGEIYAYNIGNYNGTNPQSGTNDLKTIIDSKATKSTTLSGYSIENAYTKTETDNAISNYHDSSKADKTELSFITDSQQNSVKINNKHITKNYGLLGTSIAARESGISILKIKQNPQTGKENRYYVSNDTIGKASVGLLLCNSYDNDGLKIDYVGSNYIRLTGHINNVSSTEYEPYEFVSISEYDDAQNVMGFASFAQGIFTETKNTAESAFGIGNKSNENTIHSVGIGDSFESGVRKNAFEVMQNGDIYIYGKGGYDGTNAGTSGVKTLQQLLTESGI